MPSDIGITFVNLNSTQSKLSAAVNTIESINKDTNDRSSDVTKLKVDVNDIVEKHVKVEIKLPDAGDRVTEANADASRLLDRATDLKGLAERLSDDSTNPPAESISKIDKFLRVRSGDLSKLESNTLEHDSS